jgi:hypothetical protein
MERRFVDGRRSQIRSKEYADRWIGCQRTASAVSGLPFSHLDRIVEETTSSWIAVVCAGLRDWG